MRIIEIRTLSKKSQNVTWGNRDATAHHNKVSPVESFRLTRVFLEIACSIMRKCATKKNKK